MMTANDNVFFFLIFGLTSECSVKLKLGCEQFGLVMKFLRCCENLTGRPGNSVTFCGINFFLQITIDH